MRSCVGASGHRPHRAQDDSGVAGNGEVVGIASRSGEKAREYANKYGVPQSFGSYEALLAAEVLGQLTFVHVAHSFDAGGGDNIRWYSGLGGGALFDTRSRFLIRA